MRGISEFDHMKIEAVKEYLNRYLIAKENYSTLEKLNTEYSVKQRMRSKKIMTEVEAAIALLEISRGKTIIEKRFILGEPWKWIYKNMVISRDTGYKYYRQSMLQLYECLIQNGLIKPIRPNTKTPQ